MARARHLFHPSHIPAFVAWAGARGYVRETPRGEYEVLRLRRDREVLSYYQRNRTQHITIHDDGARLFLRWLGEWTRTQARVRQQERRRQRKGLPPTVPGIRDAADGAPDSRE